MDEVKYKVVLFSDKNRYEYKVVLFSDKNRYEYKVVVLFSDKNRYEYKVVPLYPPYVWVERSPPYKGMTCRRLMVKTLQRMERRNP